MNSRLSIRLVLQLGHHLKTIVYPEEGGGCPADVDGDEFASTAGAGGLEAGCWGEADGDGGSAAGGGREPGAGSAGGGDSGRSGGVGVHVGGEAST